MATGTLAPAFWFTALDDNGAVLSGALLYFYLSGTSTPAPVYQNATLTTAWAFPAVCDSSGRIVVYLDPAVGDLKLIAKTAAGVQFGNTIDPVTPTNAGVSGLGIIFDFGSNSNAPVTQTTYTSGAGYDKIQPGSAVWIIDPATLTGTYKLETQGVQDTAGGTLTNALMNLSGGAPDTPIATCAITSSTGEVVTSSAITFPAGGANVTFGIKPKVSANTGFVVAARIVRTAALLLALWPATVLAQPSPAVFTTVKTTDTTATSLCVGCPVGSTTPASNSGATIHTITMKDATPSVTTNKVYNVGGALFFNGSQLATGVAISGTTNTVPKFTASTTLGDSNATISGSDWTITGNVTGSGFFQSSSSNALTQPLAVRNTNAGNAARVQIRVGNDTTDNLVSLVALSSTFVTSGAQIADGAALRASGLGGLSLSAEDAAGDIRFYAGGTGEDMRIHETGGVSVGDTTDPGATNFRVAGTSALVGNTTVSGTSTLTGAVRIGSTNLTDSVGTPTAAWNVGGGTITGKDYAFKLVATSGPPTSVTVTFGGTFNNAPACNVTSDGAGASMPYIVSTSTTSVVVSTASTLTTMWVLCRGF